jgi:hypothetical protein
MTMICNGCREDVRGRSGHLARVEVAGKYLGFFCTPCVRKIVPSYEPEPLPDWCTAPSQPMDPGSRGPATSTPATSPEGVR